MFKKLPKQKKNGIRGTKAVRTRWFWTKSAVADLAPRSDIEVTQKNGDGDVRKHIKVWQNSGVGEKHLR